MLCAVYVTYTTSRGKVFRDRLAHDLLLADAEELARQKQGRDYDRIEIMAYPSYPFQYGPTTETLVRSIA
jgi:hypothetical protein